MALTLHVRMDVAGEHGPADPRVSARLHLGERRKITSGSGAGQADKVFADRRTLAAGASEDLDLAGDLQDAFGRWINTEQLRVLWIKAGASNAGDLLVGGGGLAGMFGSGGDIVRVKPGGLLLLAAPNQGDWPIEAPADLLRVTNASGAGPATYDIILIGDTGPTLDFSELGNPLIALFQE